jgi:hypothetical protein
LRIAANRGTLDLGKASLGMTLVRLSPSTKEEEPGMSGNNTGAPPSPFTAAGRAHGKSAEELRNLGLQGNGHPMPSQNSSVGNAQYGNGQVSQGAGPRRASSGLGGSRGQSISQLAQSIGDMELSNETDIHAYCEAIRKVLHYFAVSTELAKGQLKAAARQQARQASDERLTLTQQAALVKALHDLSRDLDGVTKACVAGAVSATKAWRRFDTFLSNLDSEKGSKVNRPGRRGGFRLESV